MFTFAKGINKPNIAYEYKTEIFIAALVAKKYVTHNYINCYPYELQ